MKELIKYASAQVTLRQVLQKVVSAKKKYEQYALIFPTRAFQKVILK